MAVTVGNNNLALVGHNNIAACNYYFDFSWANI